MIPERTNSIQVAQGPGRTCFPCLQSGNTGVEEYNPPRPQPLAYASGFQEPDAIYLEIPDWNRTA